MTTRNQLKQMIGTKVLTLFLYEFTVNPDEIGTSVEKKCHNFSSTHPFELILVSNIFFDMFLSILKQKYPKFVVKKKVRLVEKSEPRPCLLKQEFKFLPEL